MKLALAALLLAAPAAAQSVGDCGDWTLAEYLPEPWEDHIATYAEGRIRVAVLDTMEPAAAALHLLVISPPLDETGGRQCKVVSLSGGGGRPTGFLNLDFGAREASYDAARGLVLAMPVEAYDPVNGAAVQRELTVTVDQSSGRITAGMRAE
ncbi:hypothetical protein [Paracoccus sp. S1E-3]|uniref:hypothetical protein n=1 Tax=Paracoccus sp. S1E-3 TaxID=2756130 RepID=UPI0015EE4475|nr:hypothetical protein [Paracoccus sp. S1E-3]MBA4490735.1 hypothetical protein [Paracoccus sp. S1E-3]